MRGHIQGKPNGRYTLGCDLLVSVDGQRRQRMVTLFL